MPVGIMMQLERAGIVGRQEGAKPRDILFHDLPSLEARLQELGVFDAMIAPDEVECVWVL